MTAIVRDARFAFRSGVRRPGVTLAIVLTLAMGIGANTAIINYFLQTYWRALPVPEPDRVFFVFTGTKERPNGAASYIDSEIYRQGIGDLGQFATNSFFNAVLGLPTSGDSPGKTTYRLGQAVSREYFDLLRVRFALGRGFLPEEDQPAGPAVTVVGYEFWQRHLGADAEIVGRTLLINNVSFTVIGVTPREFQDTNVAFAFYVPVARIDDILRRPSLTDRNRQRFYGLVRLSPGVSREETEARLAATAKNLDREHPWPQNQARSISLSGIEESTTEPQTGELMLAGAVGLLLLLACANVANLLLVRTAGRKRQIAVLAALGASRRRIAARLLTESVLLAMLGAALGLVFGRWITVLIKGLLEVRPVGFPDWTEGSSWLQLDFRALLVTVALSLLTACVFGLAPMLSAIRTDLVSALKSGALAANPGRRFGARQLLVVFQVSLATLLLLGGGILIRSLSGLQDTELGFETERQLLAALSTAPVRLDSSEARREVQLELYEVARSRLADLPGVESATLLSEAPGSGYARKTPLLLPQQPDARLEVDYLTVGPDFFQAFSIGLERGRVFSTEDRAGGVGAVIVNEVFVRQFLSEGQPLGREIRLPGVGADILEDRFAVVGVAADVRHRSRREEPVPLVYIPLAQQKRVSRMLAVARTAGLPQQMLASARDVLSSANPNLALIEVATYDRQIALDLYQDRFYSAFTGLFSLFGLGLACFGIYCVTSHAVSYRMREFAIRMAMGASGRDLMRLVLTETLGLIGVGILLGAVAALGMGRFVESILYGVAPNDPVTFLTLLPLLTAVGLVAAWVPAWRAGNTDPKGMLYEE